MFLAIISEIGEREKQDVCPGDTLIYNCSATTLEPSINIRSLQWTVHHPFVVYRSPSYTHRNRDLLFNRKLDYGLNITFTLTKFTPTVMESILTLGMRSSFNINGTLISCKSGGNSPLLNAQKYIDLNTVQFGM